MDTEAQRHAESVHPSALHKAPSIGSDDDNDWTCSICLVRPCSCRQHYLVCRKAAQTALTGRASLPGGPCNCRTVLCGSGRAAWCLLACSLPACMLSLACLPFLRQLKQCSILQAALLGPLLLLPHALLACASCRASCTSPLASPAGTNSAAPAPLRAAGMSKVLGKVKAILDNIPAETKCPECRQMWVYSGAIQLKSVDEFCALQVRRPCALRCGPGCTTDVG